MKRIALNIIESAFAGKRDKGGAPYVDHLKRVSANAAKFFVGNLPPDQAELLEIIGLLHDLLEDCSPLWTKKHIDSIFNHAQITNCVDYLTKIEGITYEQYINNIKGSSFACAVKLADLEDNMNLTRLKVITDEDQQRLLKYHKAFLTLKEKK